MREISIIVTVILCALADPFSAFAAATVTIAHSGGGSYVLQATGMDRAAAIDITLGYDSAFLANPRVVQGGLVPGALMAVNPNVPGTVRMAMITTNPVSGSGTIATLTFDRIGDSSGKITSLNAGLADIEGRPLPVTVQIANPIDSPNRTGAATSRSSSRTACSASSRRPPSPCPTDGPP